MRICRGCACTDDRACVVDGVPCSWALLDVQTPSGICSACAIACGFDQDVFATVCCDDAFRALAGDFENVAPPPHLVLP